VGKPGITIRCRLPVKQLLVTTGGTGNRIELAGTGCFFQDVDQLDFDAPIAEKTDGGLACLAFFAAKNLYHVTQYSKSTGALCTIKHMKRVVLGTGPWGLSVMQEEAAQGNEVVMINRSGFIREPLPAGVRIEAADIGDSAALSAVLQDADLVYHCAGTAVADWPTALPAYMDALISAAIQQQTAVVYADNLWAYGDSGGMPMSEISPENAHFPLAILRKELARRLLDTQFAGKLKVMIVRSPDFYGPRVRNSALGSKVFANLLAGKPATMIGKLDIPHSYAYIRDVGKNTVLAAGSPEAFGKIWHLPTAGPITQQQILDILRDMLSRNVHANCVSSGFGAGFNPEFKAWKDVMYQYERPYVINHSRFSTTFGERCTAHTQALWETLDWYRKSGLGTH